MLKRRKSSVVRKYRDQTNNETQQKSTHSEIPCLTAEGLLHGSLNLALRTAGHVSLLVWFHTSSAPLLYKYPQALAFPKSLQCNPVNFS